MFADAFGTVSSMVSKQYSYVWNAKYIFCDFEMMTISLFATVGSQQRRVEGCVVEVWERLYWVMLGKNERGSTGMVIDNNSIEFPLVFIQLPTTHNTLLLCVVSREFGVDLAT